MAKGIIDFQKLEKLVDSEFDSESNPWEFRLQVVRTVCVIIATIALIIKLF